jgi:hypothetical protein
VKNPSTPRTVDLGKERAKQFLVCSFVTKTGGHIPSIWLVLLAQAFICWGKTSPALSWLCLIQYLRATHSVNDIDFGMKYHHVIDRKIIYYILVYIWRVGAPRSPKIPKKSILIREKKKEKLHTSVIMKKLDYNIPSHNYKSPWWWITAPYICTLFITLDDGLIGPSLRLTNFLTDRANQPTRTCTPDRGRARTRTLATEGIGMPPRAQSQLTTHAATHASQPFSIFA